jgi:phosphoglycerate kinase
MADAKAHHVELILPVDVVVAKSPDSKRTRTVTVGQLEKGEMALDIGPASVTNINVALHGAKTVFWNGTLGLTEEPQFAVASTMVAKSLAASKAMTVIGGGDTAGFIDGLKMHEKFSFISTGGGRP